MKFKIKKIISSKGLKILVPVLIGLITVLLITTTTIAISALISNKIYKGVYINDISVAGLSVEDARNIVESETAKNIAEFKLNIACNNKTYVLENKDLNISVDVASTVNSAYQVGRQGSFFKKINDILSVSSNIVKLVPSVAYDSSKTAALVDQIYTSTYISLKQPLYNLNSNEKISIRSGSHSEAIDKEAATKSINSIINTLLTASISIPIITVKPDKIDLENTYTKVAVPPVDAYVKANGKNYVVVDHVVGRVVDKEKLKRIVDSLNSEEGIEIQIPFTPQSPARTTDYLRPNIFKDSLSSFSTSFKVNAANINRNFNISHACSVMNGLIIEPGKVFSFNTYVNNAETNKGFLDALSYVSGKVVNSKGGGICQVSTTLYNTVLLADLDVVSRRNHTFTVGYVPFGQDATVSMNSVDFQFKNSTTWPIKIVSTVVGGVIQIQIIGTNEDPGKTVKIVSEHYSNVPFTESVTFDPTKNEGYTYVTTNGLPGWTADTYKIIYRNNIEVSKTKITTSKYIPLTKSVIKGSRKVFIPDPVVTAPPVEIVPTASPVIQPTPVVPVNTAIPEIPIDIVD